MDSTITRTVNEATGMSDEEIAQVWAKMKESPFRKAIQYELEARQVIERAALDDLPPEKISKQQGICQGLTLALNILSRPANVKHPLTRR